MIKGVAAARRSYLRRPTSERTVGRGIPVHGRIPTMPMVRVRGGELAYTLTGTAGDPVVLVHGSYVDRHNWDLVVPGLSQALQVLAYDRRGYGESPPLPHPNPVRDDAEDLAGLLAELDHFPAHVIAHSYGGAVALRLASERPEMVRSLAIHEVPFVGLLEDDPTTAPEAERLEAGVAVMRTLILEGHPESAAEQLVDQFSTEPGAWGRMPAPARAMFVRNAGRWAEEYGDPEATRPDLPALHELLIPILLTEGSMSPPFLRRITQQLEHRLRNVTLQEVPDAGHAPHVSRPHQYVGLLVNFLLERNVPVT
jgi:pimeloyl-ACP methyl ester carboxylesterase